MNEPNENHCNDDEELATMLHRLFIIEGHEEVVIQHPIDGERIVTKEYYLELQDSLNRAKNMSPAQRLIETNRIRNKKQLQFRTAMIEAKHYTIDLDDEESFGYDVEGVKIDIEGMEFMPVDQYLKGIDLLKDEIGCFVDESLRKSPARLVEQISPKIDGSLN